MRGLLSAGADGRHATDLPYLAYPRGGGIPGDAPAAFPGLARGLLCEGGLMPRVLSVPLPADSRLDLPELDFDVD